MMLSWSSRISLGRVYLEDSPDPRLILTAIKESGENLSLVEQALIDEILSEEEQEETQRTTLTMVDVVSALLRGQPAAVLYGRVLAAQGMIQDQLRSHVIGVRGF